MAEEKKPLSRSEREAQIKDKAGWLITVLAALLAINTYIASGNSSKVLNNTIKANDTWAFFQAKSIKQTLAEMAYDTAVDKKDTPKAEKLKAKIDRYESDPATGEGKKELMAKARALEAERDEVKKSGPWMTFAGSGFQIAIVLLSASILAVAPALYTASIAVGALSALLMSQGIWLWLPIVL
jgi:glucan-binding YG repeat protein